MNSVNTPEYGWICPRCGTVYAPYITQCYKCSSMPQSWSNVSVPQGATCRQVTTDTECINNVSERSTT